MKNLKLNKNFKKLIATSLILSQLSQNALAYEYVVKKRDTLSKISNKAYNTTKYAQALANYNNIKDPNYIITGQLLEIPDIKVIKQYQDIVKDQIYIVKKNDTLSKITKEFYGTNEYIDKLAIYNGIENKNMIYINQIINIPSIYKLNEIEEIMYIVKKDDTLEQISNIYYGTPFFGLLLKEYNCITNNIKENDVIYIPSYNKLIELYNTIKEGNTYVKKRNI